MVIGGGLAIGLNLTLAPTAAGGRRTAVTFGREFAYRPNWGLPGWSAAEQAGAPVLCASRSCAGPGDRVRVVIVPLPGMLGDWHHVRVGDELAMYEGPRVCGTGVVLWVEATALPISEAEAGRFCARLADTGPDRSVCSYQRR